ADVYENEPQQWRPGTTAHVIVPGGKTSIPARVSSALPQADPSSHTLKLRLEADNAHFTLRPEMFVDMEVPVSLPPGLSVPADAVLDSGQRAIVYVDRGDGWFESRQVETGWRSADRIQILHGLKEGERVVSAATFLVDSESRLKATAAPQPRSSRASHASALPAGTAIDPACGMLIDVKQAIESGHTVSYGGETQYFCSESCKHKFLDDPNQSLAVKRGTFR
ncbi:MAG: YHS domain-containing protein, partial [Acidobacteria bacterium]|nr:YHS domain-containing protein [Acidobacteriota bacterium]